MLKPDWYQLAYNNEEWRIKSYSNTASDSVVDAKGLLKEEGEYYHSTALICIIKRFIDSQFPGKDSSIFLT